MAEPECNIEAGKFLCKFSDNPQGYNSADENLSSRTLSIRIIQSCPARSLH